MKKLLLVCAMGAFLFSCGKSACDCVKEGEDLAKEMISAMGDEDKLKELTKKADDLKESCKDYKEEDFKDCK
jgi:hypothetical protein